MAAPRSRRFVEGELDTLPMMGLFVVLIPMLLLSAVFLEISVIDMDVPTEAQEAAAEALGLSVHLNASHFVVEARGFRTRSIPRDTDDAETALRDALVAIAADRPENRAVTIVSQPETRYEEIIWVMDLTREVGLPQVSLSGGTS